MKTTIKTLENLCNQINVATNSPATPNIGNYHLSRSYGGVCLHRMENASGGVSTPLVQGHVPKKELELAMRSFLAGLAFRI